MTMAKEQVQQHNSYQATSLSNLCPIKHSPKLTPCNTRDKNNSNVVLFPSQARYLRNPNSPHSYSMVSGSLHQLNHSYCSAWDPSPEWLCTPQDRLCTPKDRLCTSLQPTCHELTSPDPTLNQVQQEKDHAYLVVMAASLGKASPREQAICHALLHKQLLFPYTQRTGKYM